MTDQPPLHHPPPAELADLESLALDFQARLRDDRRQLIQDRTYHLRTFPQCFLGTDAVTVLVEVLQARGYETVSRDHALEWGRAMNAQFRVLAHVTNAHVLKDEPLFYRLENNLPSQVAAARARLGNRVGDILALLEEAIECQDRIYHFRTYRNCFVGHEAVDTILELQLAIDRPSAVQLMLDCNRDCQAVEHVTRDHEFADAYLFYRFIPARERLLNNPTQRMTPTLAAMLWEAEMGVTSHTNIRGLDTSNEGSVHSEMTDDSRHSIHLVPSSPDNDSPAKNNRANGSGSAASSSSSIMDSSELVTLLPPHTTLHDIADRLERELEVKDHRYRWTVYPQCFVAQDAVTFLVQQGFAASRSRAELIGRRLEAQFHLFSHVTHAHHFRDKYYFFRFNPPEKRRVPPSPSQRQQQPQQTSNDTTPAHSTIAIPPPRKLKRAVSGQTKGSMLADLQETASSLEDIAVAFERGMKVRDRVYRLRTYPNAFTGPQATTCLVQKGFVETRPDAVLLGRILMEELDLFEHVGDDPEKEFMDCPLRVYQWTPVEQRNARMAEREPPLDSIQENENVDSEAPLLDKSLSFELQREPDEQPSQKAAVDQKLLEISAVFRQGVKIKHHRYRGRLYPDTFIGSQAVDFLVNSSLAVDRRDAILIGRRIMHELQTFDHATNDCDFSDDYKFYRFKEHRKAAEGSQNQSSLTSDAIHSALDTSRTGLGKGNKAGPKSVHSLASTPETSTDSLAGAGDFLPLEKIAVEFRRNVQVKDRRYRFSTYKNVFVGSEGERFYLGPRL